MELEPDQKVERFKVRIAGKDAEAEILDQEKARRIYEEIVRKQKDPALLEHYGSRLLRIRLFPIPPMSEFNVEIETLESLRPENGVVRVETMHARPSTFKKPLRHVTLEATIESASPIKTVFSPTHTVDVSRKNDHEARLRFERRNYVPADPLTFYYTLDGAARGATLLAFAEAGEDGSFMLTITPPAGSDEERLPRDVLFLVDRSGSMAAKGQMARARAALQTFVEGLDEKDRFNIIPFSTEASRFHREFVPATKEFQDHARRYIETLSARGGTNLEEALALAAGHAFRPEATPILVLLSDGVPTIGERDTKKLVALAGRIDARLFCFGIGFEVNTRLLDRLALSRGGDRQYVHPNENLEVVLETFARKIDAPILADPVLRFGEDADVSDVYPKKLPTLFRGGSILVYGRYRGEGPRAVELTGTARGRSITHRYTLEFASRDRYDFVPRLWAIQKIDYLLDQIRTHGTSKELVDHIVEIAKRHGIVTPYTSFLMTEDTPTAAANRHVLSNGPGIAGQRLQGPEGVPQGREPDALAVRPDPRIADVRLQQRLGAGQHRAEHRRRSGPAAPGGRPDLLQRPERLDGCAVPGPEGPRPQVRQHGVLPVPPGQPPRGPVPGARKKRDFLEPPRVDPRRRLRY